MTGHLIITRGLPCSGKSTWAANHVDRGDADRIVCMDDIRVFLNAEFPNDEGLVKDMRDLMIRNYLSRGLRVVSSDTNLSPKALNRLIQIAESQHVGWEIEDFTHVPLKTCLERNDERWRNGDFKVPNQAIVKMYDTYLAKT